MTYKTYFIKDSKIEDIECIFYSFIQFLSEILAETPPKKVLVHCVQGVSRSVTLTMAFLMHSFNLSFRQCFSFVKQRRGVASPNLGFVSQLLDFERRLKASKKNHSEGVHVKNDTNQILKPNNSDKIRFGKLTHSQTISKHLELKFRPRIAEEKIVNQISSITNSYLSIDKAVSKAKNPVVFCLGSHQIQDPFFLVFRRIDSRKMYVSMKSEIQKTLQTEGNVKENDDDRLSERFMKSDFKLDPRGIFLVIDSAKESVCYVWKGNIFFYIIKVQNLEI